MFKSDGMTQRVAKWTDTIPDRAWKLLANVAEGDEFAWGDDDLAELVADLLSVEPGILGADWMDAVGVDRTEAARVGAELASMAQEPPHWVDHVDWEAVRNHLTGEGA
jgi:hypothetical protein